MRGLPRGNGRQLRFPHPSWRDIERLAFEGRISIAELCRRAGVNSSTFRYWKGNRTTPSVAIVQALLDAGLAAVKEAEKAADKTGEKGRRRPEPVKPTRSGRRVA